MVYSVRLYAATLNFSFPGVLLKLDAHSPGGIFFLSKGVH